MISLLTLPPAAKPAAETPTASDISFPWLWNDLVIDLPNGLMG